MMALEVRDLVRHFGGVRAVQGVSFRVEAGECVALIGPNGAGKSTTFACVAGQQRLSAGGVVWCGQRIDGLSPAQRQSLGVGRTFQVAQCFDALSVLDNLQLVGHAGRRLRAWDQLAAQDDTRPRRWLARTGLERWAGVAAGELPYGARKRLELAMALHGLQARSNAGPALLLLDEPAAGLSAAERVPMMRLVQGLTREGLEQPGGRPRPLAVLYTEHNMDAVFGVADRVLVLIEGRLVAVGAPDAVAREAVVRERYLGTDFNAEQLHA
jgi:branched-chain amino acid transport system ATP-binding protein